MTDAWKQNPLFGIALDLAHWAGVIKRLADYIATTPLTMDEQVTLAGFIRSLQKRGRGRPPNLNKPANADIARAALHNAFYLVQLRQQAWLRQNPSRKNVPGNLTEDYISEATVEAEKAFGKRPDRNSLRKLVAKNDRTTTADK